MEPPRKTLERQITSNKWEEAEEHMKSNPHIAGMIVLEIPGKHIYKLVRRGNRLVRLHIVLSRDQ